MKNNVDFYMVRGCTLSIKDQQKIVPTHLTHPYIPIVCMEKSITVNVKRFFQTEIGMVDCLPLS